MELSNVKISSRYNMRSLLIIITDYRLSEKRSIFADEMKNVLDAVIASHGQL